MLREIFCIEFFSPKAVNISRRKEKPTNITFEVSAKKSLCLVEGLFRGGACANHCV
jgi:hypothetical protein